MLHKLSGFIASYIVAFLFQISQNIINGLKGIQKCTAKYIVFSRWIVVAYYGYPFMPIIFSSKLNPILKP
ncbi:hypothetical protein SDC9_195064 [bioreactor metagenome]|uniref:Uncharacterized protein n=1 Tax=bioreactor metagenome TaxID=1076179 RepID=A0A645I9H6_9ZZZZ